MKASELPASPDLAIPAVPAICDQCRQEGRLGQGPFSALPDILAFTPVPRRAHANGWREEHQRAFIAALAITGSPKQAARAIGRHQFGAEQLRSARGGKGFAEAWDAAMEMAREREVHRIHGNLAELADRREAELAAIVPEPAEAGLGPWRGERPDWLPDHYPDDYEFSPGEQEVLELKERARSRMRGARRIYLACIANDPDKRAAWETLCGPTDWELAAQFEAQPGEPRHPNVRQPDTQLLAENGFLADLIGGEDKLTPIKRQLMGIDPIAE